MPWLFSPRVLTSFCSPCCLLLECFPRLREVRQKSSWSFLPSVMSGDNWTRELTSCQQRRHWRKQTRRERNRFQSTPRSNRCRKSKSVTQSLLPSSVSRCCGTRQAGPPQRTYPRPKPPGLAQRLNKRGNTKRALLSGRRQCPTWGLHGRA